MKRHIKSVVSLTAVCAVIAILLALTNFITAPIIKQQEADAVNSTLSIVLPNGKGFKLMDISKLTLPESVSEVYTEDNGGYVFKVTTSGYSSGMVILCGISAEGKVMGATCIASSETLGVEANYGDTLVDATADTIGSVDTVAGATKTTAGYRNAVKDALNAFIIIGGGEVDLRDEAQILSDNLNEALGTTDVEFDKVFVAEVIDADIDAVYTAKNGAGYVLKIGEQFVATDAEGNLKGESEHFAKAEDAVKKLIASASTEIDLSGFELPSQIQKAFKTASGNYVFELRASGYGINGGDAWHPASGEYIYIRVAATAEGKIISCLTLAQKETEGIGSACADESFYSQFNGKDESNYKNIDAIAGATVTTNGYTTAISKVFEAINILKGGA